MHRVRLERRREAGGGGSGVRRPGGRGCDGGRGRGGAGRSFGRGGGPEFCQPLPGWKQDDREDYAETEDSRGYRKGHGVTVGGRDRRRQRPRGCAAR